jgi:hypothetical protein
MFDNENTKSKKGRKYLFILPFIACILMLVTVGLLIQQDNNIEVVVEKNSIDIIFGEGVVSPPKLKPEDTFVVSLKCDMKEPVKGFETKVSFDPDVIRVLNVSRGTIFENYKDFFSPGVLDNNNGTIVNIFNLIVGSGSLNMTSNPGSLVKITFYCVAPGMSKINIYDTKLTNATGYIPVTLTNSSVVVYEN